MQVFPIAEREFADHKRRHRGWQQTVQMHGHQWIFSETPTILYTVTACPCQRRSIRSATAETIAAAAK